MLKRSKIVILFTHMHRCTQEYTHLLAPIKISKQSWRYHWSESQENWFSPKLCHFLAVWPWAGPHLSGPNFLRKYWCVTRTGLEFPKSRPNNDFPNSSSLHIHHYKMWILPMKINESKFYRISKLLSFYFANYT